MNKRVFSFILFFLYFLALILISKKIFFFKVWFYNFIWWGYILIFDYFFLKSQGISVFFKNLKDGVKGVFFSVFIWNIFEIYNIFLKNWSYHNLPSAIFERWMGYFLGFGTVVYGIYVSTAIIFHFFKGKKLFKIDIYSYFLKRKKLSTILGVICLILPLLYGRYFFPLIWLSFIFLFLSIVKKLPEVFPIFSNLDLIEKFNYLIWGGLFAGFLWEFWNSFALSRWKYHLPFLNHPKIFEMPVAGFSGFMPFGIEVYLLYSFMKFIESKTSSLTKILFYLILFLEIFFTFYIIDSFSLSPLKLS